MYVIYIVCAVFVCVSCHEILTSFAVPRPDATYREQNHLLLLSTFLSGSDNDPDESLEAPCLSMKRRIEAAEFLLDVANGQWSSDEISHTCRLGCCRSVQESKLKFWVAVQAPCLQRVASQSVATNLL